ncbi:hypothetical protein Tco_1186445 [Tanacetum coccineum]
MIPNRPRTNVDESSEELANNLPSMSHIPSLKRKVIPSHSTTMLLSVPPARDAKSNRGLPSKVNKARGAQIHVGGHSLGKSQFGGVTDWYQSQGYREPVVMSSASSAVTYTSVYTDSEPGQRSFLPVLVVPPPHHRILPGLEDPQTPPVPQSEDEPELPGYVIESDPEEDPKKYEDDEAKDGPVDYPMDGGDDGDDDDGDSSGDDADDEDEDDEDEEEEEEHLASADFAVVVPADEPVFSPEGTELVIPPPSTDLTIRARITVRP